MPRLSAYTAPIAILLAVAVAGLALFLFYPKSKIDKAREVSDKVMKAVAACDYTFYKNEALKYSGRGPNEDEDDYFKNRCGSVQGYELMDAIEQTENPDLHLTVVATFYRVQTTDKYNGLILPIYVDLYDNDGKDIREAKILEKYYTDEEYEEAINLLRAMKSARERDK